MTHTTDPQDVHAFCTEVSGPLVGSLALYLGDRAVAEELAQEALARTWERWATIESPRAWVYRTAFNLARSSVRRRLAERQARRRLDAQAAVLRPPPDADAAIAVRQAVAALPRRQREVVIARFYADLSVAEAAEAMGCRPGTVKALTSQAITSLRAAGLHMDDPGIDDPDTATPDPTTEVTTRA